MDVTLDQLRALDAVVRTGSFSEAAVVLHKVPSGVSYTIKGLEQAVGLTLFDRRRRTASLTPAGQRILEAGRLVLREQQLFERLALSLGDGWEPACSERAAWGPTCLAECPYEALFRTGPKKQGWDFG